METMKRKGMDYYMNHSNILKKKKLLLQLCMITWMLFMTGCATNEINDTKVVLTTGFEKDEVFKIEQLSCKMPEVMVYLMNTKNQYENVLGEEVWTVSADGEILNERMKDIVLARLSRIKAMNLMAQRQNITLDEAELEKLTKAANVYFASLSNEEVQALHVTEEMILQMYQEKALADKVYQALIADINPEISDDEARTITVQMILCKTYHLNENGEKVEYSEQSKKEAYEKMKEALQRAKEGENFEVLASEYSDTPNNVLSFGKGVYDKAFEEVAFNLSNNEISNIISTEEGYVLLKCISTFDREETDRNKVKIVEERRKEVFNEQYTAFISSLTKIMNDKLWEKVSFIENTEITTDSFFDVYQEYMK